MVISAGGLMVTALVVYFVTKHAAEGTLDVNGGVGIKTRLTRSSQQAWEIGHRAALPWVRRCALLCLGTGVLALVSFLVAEGPLLGQTVPVFVLIVGYGGLVVLLARGTVAANRAVRSSGDERGR